MSLSVREAQTGDIPLILSYWFGADPDHLRSMGADPAKLPDPVMLTGTLTDQFNRPYEQKNSYALIWMVDDKPAGHCNLNPVKFGETGNLHLHIWQAVNRRRGTGAQLVKESLDYFFKNMNLVEICSEPWVLNDAPNRALAKAGFELEKNYITIPGSMNFEQEVNRWKITRQQWISDLQSSPGSK